MTVPAIRDNDCALMPVMSIEQAVARYNAMVEFTKTVMVKDQDYGVIPGVSKPCLYKPGAEKLSSLFGLSPCFSMIERVEDWTGREHGGEPFFYFFYKCQLLRGGIVVGEGDGSCNSWEKKYRYRNAERKCPQCGKPTLIMGKPEYERDERFKGGFICFAKKGGCGAKFMRNDPEITSQSMDQVANPDVAELVNTLQKMAQKRAMIAAVLIACNASAFFTQDVEDMRPIDVEYEEIPHETPQEVAARKIKENNERRVAEGKEPILEANLRDNEFAGGTRDGVPSNTGLAPEDTKAPLNPLGVAPRPPASDYEQRHAARIMEAAEILEQPAAPKAERKRGAISFTALKKWGEAKKQILAATGATDLYYEALRMGGYEHADEIRTPEEAKAIWKELQAVIKRHTATKQTETLEQELQRHADNMAPGDFMRCLGSNGFESIADVIERATGTQLDALLRDLRPTE